MRALLLCALVVASCSAPPPPSAASPLLGGPAPDFQRKSVDGGDVDTRVARGGVLVIAFYKGTCERCIRSLLAAQALFDEAERATFVAVSEDENLADARDGASSLKLRLPVVHDAAKVLAERFRLGDVPRTFVIDAGGTVRWIGDDGAADSALAAAVASARKPR